MTQEFKRIPAGTPLQIIITEYDKFQEIWRREHSEREIITETNERIGDPEMWSQGLQEEFGRTSGLSIMQNGKGNGVTLGLCEDGKQNETTEKDSEEEK